MASLRQLKTRIKSVENIKKVTSAMEMVSGAKLRKIEAPLHRFRPYMDGLNSMTRDLLRMEGLPAHPLMETRSPVNAVALCVITSDAGLCGTYNHNIINKAEEFLLLRSKDSVHLTTVGKKGSNYFSKRGYDMASSRTGLTVRFSEEATDELAKLFIDSFLNKEVDEVYVAYTRYVSAFRYTPTVEKLLNVGGLDQGGEEFILEPDAMRILENMLPRFVTYRLRHMLLEAATSEHSSRMLAMRAASDNANELVDSLTLERNKARQASITKELIEITSAAESLKG